MILKRVFLTVFLVVLFVAQTERLTKPNDSNERLERLMNDLMLIQSTILWVDDISVKKDMERRKLRKEIEIRECHEQNEPPARTSE